MSTEPAGEATSLLDTLRVGIVMLDGQGTVLLWSPTTEAILGRSAGDTVGTRFQDLIVGDDDGGGAEERDRIRESLRRDHRWRGVMHVRHGDGHPVEVEGRTSLLWDTENRPFVVGALMETSRIRAVEHDLAALDALFAYSPHGIALFDTEKRFVRFNPALARLNDAADENLLGKTVREVLPSEMAEEVLKVQSSVLRTGRSVVDMVMTAPDGLGARSVSYSRLTDRRGEVLGVSCTITDITERLEALTKVEAARGRLALLDDVGVALGDLLDVRAVSQALASALVPRIADYSGVLLRGEVATGGDLPSSAITPGTPIHQLGAAARYSGEAVDRLMRLAGDTHYEHDSFVGRALATGEPQLAVSREEIRRSTRHGDPKVDATLALGVHSLMAVPLRARGIVLGLLLIGRAEERAPFDRDDLALGMELADRAGTSLDNARLYARERQGALVLQRSLLPQHIPEPPGVALAYRYVPGSSGTEVGGDWFDVIPLPGRRVAFVVGDVMGHGLHSAVTMGRLRTAVRTLAGLDLPPDELLSRVSELGDDLAQSPGETLMATCLYAVYEPAPSAAGEGYGLLTMAGAGHPPPVLVTHDAEGACHARTLDLPPGAPLGVSGVTGGTGGSGGTGGASGEERVFETVERQVEEGSVLVLYTDGLVESREADISEGIDRVCAMLTGTAAGAAAGESPETACGDIGTACDALIGTLERPDDTGTEHLLSTSDDVALLMARLGALPEGTAASWSFGTGDYAVRRAREAVRETLHAWGLGALEDTGVLLVSELVTNALRYAHGPVGVRMVRDVKREQGAHEGTLVVEVSDPRPEPPQERTVTSEHEGGRGIQLVASEAGSWGTRVGPAGKTVWFELPLP